MITLIIIIPYIDRVDISQYYYISELIIIGLLVILSVIFIYFQLEETSWTQVDNFLIASMLTAIVQFSVGKSLQGSFSYIWNYLILFTVLLLLIRVVQSTINNSKGVETKGHVGDLENSIGSEKITLFHDAAVDYDLLENNRTIDRLLLAIKDSTEISTFTISLTGAWGTGKTTIVNNVIKKLNVENSSQFVFVKEFEPWQYDTEVAMLEALLQAIFLEMKMMNKIVNQRYITAALSTVSNKIGSSFFRNYDQSIQRMKMGISARLKKKKQRLVIVIDNIERIPPENILFIFKLISTTLKIDGVTFLVVYDEVEMDKIFTKKLNINYDYLDKVIQLPISFPLPNQKTLNNQIVDSFLKQELNLDSKAIQKIQGLLHQNISNIRQLKRFLNSIYYLRKNNQLVKSLYMPDLISFELLRFLSPKIYVEVANNYLYYMKTNQHEASDFLQGGQAEFENNKKQYFEDLNSNEKYRENQKYIEQLFSKEENSIGGNRIYDGKCFLAYSDYQTTTAIKVYEAVDLFFRNLSLGRVEVQYRELFELSNKDTVVNLKEKQQLLLQLYLHIQEPAFFDNMSDQKVEELVRAILQYRYVEDFYTTYISRSIIDIIYVLIELLNDNQRAEIFVNMQTDYKNIYLYHQLKLIIDDKKIWKSQYEETFKILIKNCIQKNIDLFSKTYYHRYNFYMICHYSQREKLDFESQEYLVHILDKKKENIFLLLFDYLNKVTIYGSKEYEYSYSSDLRGRKFNFVELISPSEIMKLIDEINTQRSLNTVEEFLKNVFEKQILSDDEEYSNGIKTAEIIPFDEYLLDKMRS